MLKFLRRGKISDADAPMPGVPVLEPWALESGNGEQIYEEPPRAADPEEELDEPKIPRLSALTRLRRVTEDTIEDYSGTRYSVWRVGGADPFDSRVEAGWMSMLNSLEFPVQILIRQHAPDYSGVRASMRAAAPPRMREGDMGKVAGSLINYFENLESDSGVVARRRYVSARADRSMEMGSALSRSGLEFERLDNNGLEQLLQACYSGMGAGYEREMFQVRERPSRLELNDRYFSAWEVTSWPRRISFLYLENLLQSGDEMDVSLWMWPASQRESHSHLQRQRVRFEGAKLTSMQQGKLVTPDVELAISDSSRIADSIERGVSKLFRRTMVVGVYGRTLEELKEVEERMTSHFRATISKVSNLKFRQGKGFAALMPARRPGLYEADMTDTDTMSCMFPFSPPDLDRREGIMLGMDLRSKTPVFVDAFSPDAMNGHMVVMARSGAGKSFFTKLRVVREAERGVPIYLIDPEGEYGVITRLLGGTVFVPGMPGHGLNPFLATYTNDGDLSKRVASLCGLVGVMLEGNVDQELKASVDRCLSGFYHQELERVRADRPRDPSPLLGESGIGGFHDFLCSERAAEWGGQRLAHLLSPFATGSSRYLMQGSGHNLLENESPVTSFNLKSLPNSLKPVATSVCSEVVWALAVSDPKPRLLVVDECWTVLSTPSGAEALITIVKRARKYYLGLVTITQDVQDFLAEDATGGVIAGHAGRSLLQNSALKLAFQQDPAALPLVGNALALSDDVIATLNAASRGQGVLVGERGDTYPIEIISTQEERDLLLDRNWLTDGEASLLTESAPIFTEENSDGDGLSDRLLQRLAYERNLDQQEEAATLGLAN